MLFLHPFKEGFKLLHPLNLSLYVLSLLLQGDFHKIASIKLFLLFSDLFLLNLAKF